MINELFINKDLSQDFDTEWFSLVFPKLKGIREKIAANTLIITWSGVAGAFDGQITILGSPDCQNTAYGAVVSINKSETAADSWIFKIASYISYIKIIYSKNGNTSGQASAFIEYNN